MPDNEFNNAGIIRTFWFRAGSPVEVFIDHTNIYHRQQSPSFMWEYLAKFTEDGAAWVPIIEKAWAKLNGSFDFAVGGTTGEVYRHFMGAPTDSITLSSFTSTEIWDMVEEAYSNGYVLSLGTAGGGNDQLLNAYELAQSHAYLIVKNGEYQNAAGQMIKLYQIRNPWKKERHLTQAFSDASSNWDATLIANVNADAEQDFN